MPQVYVAAQMGVSRATVGKWWHRFCEHGEAGLVGIGHQSLTGLRGVLVLRLRLECAGCVVGNVGGLFV